MGNGCIILFKLLVEFNFKK